MNLLSRPVFETYLQNFGFLRPSETLREVSKAGTGNMNLTLRCVTSQRSFILKQSFPYVYKYPTLPAPIERGQTEAAFYKTIAKDKALERLMPQCFFYDAQKSILGLEDFSPSQDCTSIYSTHLFNETDLNTCLNFLKALHTLHAPRNATLENPKMKQLNHEHIFQIPFTLAFAETLDAHSTGLTTLAREVISNSSLQKKITDLGQLYLQDGSTLLHGDFFPGSWLATTQGLRFIDPEFCFYGPPEFDYGVMQAHLIFADVPQKTLIDFESKLPHNLNRSLVHAFAGTEILRRLLGVAQLPLNASTEKKEVWINQAKAWI